MSIYLDKNSKIFVQGITGAEGSYHTGRMLAYGTNIVGGVTPGKGGQKSSHGLPVFNTVQECRRRDGCDAHVHLRSACRLRPTRCSKRTTQACVSRFTITEGVAGSTICCVVVGTTAGMQIIGPNCPGLISPGKASVGIMPGHIFKEGNVGLISRSGTLTYEVVDGLTRAGLGQSTCVGIGGDPIIGTTFVDCLRAFKNDPETKAVVVCGEIGGSDEEDAAGFIKEHLAGMPIVGFIGGRNAPPGKSLGHAGAIISGNFGTPQSKIAAFQAAGVPVADRPSDIPRLLAERMAALV